MAAFPCLCLRCVVVFVAGTVIDDVLKAFVQYLYLNHTYVGMNASLHMQIGSSDLLPRVHYLQENIPLYVYWPPW